MEASEGRRRKRGRAPEEEPVPSDDGDGEEDTSDEEEEESVNGEEEQQERFKIIDDSGVTTRVCPGCQAEMPGYGEVWLCEACLPEKPSSISPFILQHLSHQIDASGMIWSGMPDNPEPETSIKGLPIWHEHKDMELYRRFPCSKLMQQLDLAYRMSPRAPPGAKLYGCFICGKEHDAAKAPADPFERSSEGQGDG